MSCLELAHATGEFEMPIPQGQPGYMCPDAKPLWRTIATRWDVYVWYLEGGLAAASHPHCWPTCCVTDNVDDTLPLRATNANASLNDQVQAMELCTVPGHGVARFTCHSTRDSKGMPSMNH